MPADASAVQIVIGGVDLTRFARVGRVRIDDVLNDAANTAALTVILADRIGPFETGPFAPHAFDAGGFNTRDNASPVLRPPAVQVGAPIGIFVNGGADQIFGGEILTRAQYAELDRPAHVRLDLTCTDYTRRLDRRQVVYDYPQMSATAMVVDLITRFCLGITTAHVQAGLDAITGGITFTWEQPSRALSRIAEKIGAYWYIDYLADLHFYTGTEPGIPTPAPLVPGGRFADLKVTADLSQVRTRVYVEGDGGTVLLALPDGDPILPLSQTGPFNPAGGLATMAPWRVTYTGVHDGGAKANTTAPAAGGSGGTPPPAAPGAPTAALAPAGTAGALVGGPYTYAVTLELADESRSALGAPSAPVTITAITRPAPIASAALPASPIPGPITVGATVHYATAFVDGAGADTGITPTGGNAVTGRPIATPTGLTVSPIGGGGALAAGWYHYAVTFLTTAGETLPAIVSNQQAGAAGQFSIGVPIAADGRVVGRRLYRSSVAAAAGAAALPWRQVVDLPNNTTATWTDGAADATLPAKNYPAFSSALEGEAAIVPLELSPDARIVGRRLYRQDPYGDFRLIREVADNTTTTFTDQAPVAGGAVASLVNKTGAGAVNVTAIPIGPAGTIRRRLFRTAAGGSEYRELVSLENNTTATYLDTTADSNLGGSPLPAQGVPGTAGTIPPAPAGASTLELDGLAGFPAAGWAAAESVLIRYTGTSTAGGRYFLTGIPASGPGALAADMPAGTVITASPALVGVAPVYGASLGDAVQLLVQVDDVPAQTALAALEGGDGVIEYYIQDRRLSEAGARGRGLAELELFKTVELQLSYTTHDGATASGRTVHVDLPAPTNLAGDFLIQKVTIDDVSIAAHYLPRRKVDASSTRFSFDDVLNRILMESH